MERAASILQVDVDHFFIGAWINTFHSLSNRILRDDDNCTIVGLRPDYHILDEQDQIRFLRDLLCEDLSTKDVLMRLLHEEKTKKGEQVRIKTLPFSRIAKIIDDFKNSCIFPEDLEKVEDYPKFDRAVFLNVYQPY